VKSTSASHTEVDIINCF